jgi:hypothetical protein
LVDRPDNTFTLTCSIESFLLFDVVAFGKMPEKALRALVVPVDVPAYFDLSLRLAVLVPLGTRLGAWLLLASRNVF